MERYRLIKNRKESRMYNNKILIIDDEIGIINMLETVLRKEGYTLIKGAVTGKEALSILNHTSFDLILLDVMLPDTNGFELCQKIRVITDAPILFLTARTSDLDKLKGLSIGGDDYITKPFNILEVVARINIQFRRMKVHETKQNKQEILEMGYLYIDLKAAQLKVKGQEIHCPAKELELLFFLAQHPNQVFTAGQLYENIWGYDSMGDEKTVSIHIMRLRKKIEVNPKSPQIIINLRGIGYKFVPPIKG